MTVFEENIRRIKGLSAAMPNTEFGLTKHNIAVLLQFADLTKEEFAQRYLNTKVPEGLSRLEEHLRRRISRPVADLPSSWIAPTVTPVRDQGQCGSCWAFATAAVMESAWLKSTGNMTQFSTQQLVDCDTASQGCSGGNMDTPYDYVIGLSAQGGGLEREEDYPYTAQDGQCLYNASKAVGNFSYGFFVVFDESKIDSDVFKSGPLSFGIDATVLQFYKSGVIEDNPECLDQVNHLVVLIGWGSDASGQYWVVKTPKCKWECGYESDGCDNYVNCGLCKFQEGFTCDVEHTCIKDWYDGPNMKPDLDTITTSAMTVDFKGWLSTMCFLNYSFVPKFGAPWVDYRCPLAGYLGFWNDTYHWFARIPMSEDNMFLEATAWCLYGSGDRKYYPGHNDTTRYVRFQYDTAGSAAIRAISDDTGTIGISQGVSANEAAKIAVTVQGNGLSGVQCAVAYSVLDRFGEEWADVHEVGMQGEQESWYLAVEMPAAGHVLEAKVGCQAANGVKVWTTEKYLFYSL
eukprot:m51a1_g9535 hypothetical protein (516) ;mRNA; r:813498-815572